MFRFTKCHCLYLWYGWTWLAALILVLIVLGALDTCWAMAAGAGLCLVARTGPATAFRPFPWLIAASRALVSSMDWLFSCSFLPALLASISSLSLVISFSVSLVILSITDNCLLCVSPTTPAALCSYP